MGMAEWWLSEGWVSAGAQDSSASHFPTKGQQQRAALISVYGINDRNNEFLILLHPLEDGNVSTKLVNNCKTW
jgi:hypothetical protein